MANQVVGSIPVLPTGETLAVARQFKRAWALGQLARLVNQDSKRLVAESRELVALARRCRLRVRATRERQSDRHANVVPSDQQISPPTKVPKASVRMIPVRSA